MKTVTSQRCRGVRGCPRQSRFRVSEACGSRLCDKYISALYESDLYNIGWPRTGLTYTSRANRAQRSSSPFRAQCHSKMHAKPMYSINAYIKYIYHFFISLYQHFYIHSFLFLFFCAVFPLHLAFKHLLHGRRHPRRVGAERFFPTGSPSARNFFFVPLP
jgi:hypothetical protein